MTQVGKRGSSSEVSSRMLHCEAESDMHERAIHSSRIQVAVSQLEHWWHSLFLLRVCAWFHADRCGLFAWCSGDSGACM